MAWGSLRCDPNTRPKEIVADQVLDIFMLKEVAKGTSEPGTPPPCGDDAVGECFSSQIVVRVGPSANQFHQAPARSGPGHRGREPALSAP